MKCFTLLPQLFLLAVTFDGKMEVVKASGGHKCACEAEEFGFEINCEDQATMIAAVTALKSSGCATDCSSAECEKNYLIVQSHHDYCREAEIPAEIEDSFHDYDDSCVACDIDHPFTEGAPDCPAVSCEDGSGNLAYTAMLDNDCLSDCSSEFCGTNFLTLLTVHDICDHDALNRAAEEGLHDMEDSCQDIHICNAVDGGANQLVCDEHHSDDHDEDSSAAVKVTATASGVLMAYMALAY